MGFCCEMGVGLRILDVCTRVPSMVFGCLNKMSIMPGNYDQVVSGTGAKDLVDMVITGLGNK